MNPERQQAINYLRADSNEMWRWAEDGAVVVWKDGTTVAFREEVIQILQWLGPNGLPPFGAIVLMLAACRGKMPEVAALLGGNPTPMPGGQTARAALLTTARRQLAAQLDAAQTELAKLPRLPAELISGLNAKCVLAEAIFETAKVERFVEAAPVLRGLRGPISETELNGEGSGAGGNPVRRLHMVAEGLKRHSADSLALRIQTGLDALPRAIDENLPVAERARRLIEELSRDREHGAVARAARELMAAVCLPRRLAQREELALGGLSDITNRGPLDRLLLSELAHDDLTLAVRVALNEALYLRREPPMREPPGTLAILLDSGLRLWGIPRLLASAVALALAACDKRHARVLVWRACGKEIAPVDLLSRKGLAEHLGALVVEAHCGASLPAFAAALPPHEDNQSVLVTHADTLKDPEFRRALAAARPSPSFIATVDRAGHFELHPGASSCRRPLCEAEIEVASVFAERSGAIPLLNAGLAAQLPAIFNVAPFPLLLPIAGRLDYWTRTPDGITYASLNDRRLVQFRGVEAGGRFLHPEMPPGKTVWMSADEQTVHVVKTSTSRYPSRLVSVPISGGPARVVDLDAGSELLAVHRAGDVILCIRRHDVRAYSLADGSSLGRALNHYSWVHGRFLRGKDKFWFPVWDGQHVKFEPITMASSLAPPVIAAIFDHDGEEGPFVVHRGGEVICTATGERIKLPIHSAHKYSLDNVHISRDGRHVFAATKAAKWACLLDLETRNTQDLSAQQANWSITVDAPPPLPKRNLFRVVESIAPSLDRGVAFRGRNARWRILALSQNRLGIGDLSASRGEEYSKLDFALYPVGSRLGCSLQVAEWPSGSKAFLDSRGLLHLKSHDPAVPEVSLVLADEAAGWTSDGYVCGPAFYFDGPRASQPEKVMERIQAFGAKALAGAGIIHS